MDRQFDFKHNSSGGFPPIIICKIKGKDEKEEGRGFSFTPSDKKLVATINEILKTRDPNAKETLFME